MRRYRAANRALTDARVARWLSANPDRARAIHNRYNRRLREDVLIAYGHACRCCGLTQSEFLTFDHIAADGAARRRAGEPIGASLYQLLKRQRFPQDGIQLLCHSCNMAKAFCGVCPHEATHLESNDAEGQSWYRRMRQRVIAGYGGRCTCCGEQEPAFLAIDHVYNDGAAERAATGMSGGQWYRWLIVNQFPQDRYRLLCHCCNAARAYYGICPHERGRAAAE